MSVKKTVIVYQHPTMPLGDEPMRMRLLPPIKYDSHGERIHDGKRRKWFSHFRWNKEMIESTLNAFEHETRKAQIELGKLMEKLEHGEVVGKRNKKLKFLCKDPNKVFITKKKTVNHQFVGLWKNHVCRLLGNYTIDELNCMVFPEKARKPCTSVA